MAVAGTINEDGENIPGEDYELVYIDDGVIQCEFPGLSEQETAQPLIDKGIDVMASSCGYLSDLAVATVCGTGDSNIHLHEINSQNIEDAQQLGFESVTTLENEASRGYELIDCPE